MLRRSLMNAFVPLFCREKREDIPANRNIIGINHGSISVTTKAIGLTASKKI